MSEAKSARPTPGPWISTNEALKVDVHHEQPWNMAVVDAKHGKTPIGLVAMVFGSSPEGVERRAALIAEAGTVYHETQLTPRELADQRAELLAVLITVRDNMRKGVTGQEARKGWDLVNAAIAKAGAA